MMIGRKEISQSNIPDRERLVKILWEEKENLQKKRKKRRYKDLEPGILSVFTMTKEEGDVKSAQIQFVSE